MKILFLNANRKGIGTYHRCLGLAKALIKCGHTITLMTTSLSSRWKRLRYCDGNLVVIECPNFLDTLLPWHASGPLDIFYRTSEILFGNYALIYAFEYQPNVSIPIYLTRNFKKYAFWSDWCDWHSGGSYRFGGYAFAHAIDKFFEERIRYFADTVIVISRKLYQRALSLGIPKDKILLLPEGVDTQYMWPYPKKEMRLKFGFSLNSKIIATIYDDNQECLIDAFSRVISIHPNTYFLFIGNVQAKALKMANDRNVMDKLILVGKCSDADLPKYLSCADVCVLAMQDNIINQARWPHKIGDFLSTGVPTVITPVGDVAELFKKNEIGRLTSFNPENIAVNVCYLLSNPSYSEKLGRNARQIMQKEYDWDILGKRLMPGLIEVETRAIHG